MEMVLGFKVDIRKVSYDRYVVLFIRQVEKVLGLGQV